MEGLNGHFCHGFYPQVRPKSRINVLIEQSNKATEIASQKISDAKKLMAFMKGKLPVEKPTFTEDELTTIRFRDNLLKNAYGISEFEELLYWSVYAGLLEFDGMYESSLWLLSNRTTGKRNATKIGSSGVPVGKIRGRNAR